MITERSWHKCHALNCSGSAICADSRGTRRVIGRVASMPAKLCFPASLPARAKYPTVPRSRLIRVGSPRFPGYSTPGTCNSRRLPNLGIEPGILPSCWHKCHVARGNSSHTAARVLPASCKCWQKHRLPCFPGQVTLKGFDRAESSLVEPILHTPKACLSELSRPRPCQRILPRG